MTSALTSVGEEVTTTSGFMLKMTFLTPSMTKPSGLDAMAVGPTTATADILWLSQLSTVIVTLGIKPSSSSESSELGLSF